MGVGAGLYMCDVVKKVHVRYLISWWVLVLYGLETCSLKKAELRSLDFVSDRLFMKLDKNMDKNAQKLGWYAA